ncbi:MAG: adenylate/guanylate cyclase domain-containing protein [Candidatus Methylomirabilia bacterium]
MSRREPLGRMLVRAKVVSEDQLRAALEVQRLTKQQLGRIIVEQKFASEYAVLQAIAKYYRVSATALSDDFAALLEPRTTSWRDKLAHLRIPIGIKLSIAITFMIWLTILTLSVVILARQRERLYAQSMRTGEVSLNYFANNAAQPLLEDDTLRLNTLIKESTSVEGLVYASIVDRAGVIKAHTDTARIGSAAPAIPAAEQSRTEGTTTSVNFRGPDGAHLMNLSRPVAFSGTALGEANVGISLDFIDAQMRRESLTIIVLSLFIVLLGISIAIMIGVGFARPIAQLVLATHEIGKGNFQYRVERVRGDEFGDLASAFNYMSRELWKKLVMTKSFGSYVSPEILEMVMAHPDGDLLGGKRMEVTVVFTDIRGFTAYAETKDPEHVVKAINEYFEIATRHIQKRGGYVDKFIGDAVLGVFGVPLAQPDHALRAVQASVAMQRELLAQDPERNPLLAKVGIGINSGVAVAGDLGSEVKRQYSVIGDCVNVASRINALAAGGKTIISRSTREAAGPLVEVLALPPARVKGKSEPIEIFEVSGVTEDPAAAA